MYIGLMSGTSMDAVDVALVEFADKAKLIGYREYSINKSLRKTIRKINATSPFADVANMDHVLGELFATSANNMLQEMDLEPTAITAIGSHGQTVLHFPEGPETNSIQIGDPNLIAANTGITTVADFRRMDMAFGGQGAPLASGFHQYQFQRENTTTIMLNIGGMANITLLNDGKITGFDTGPGNALLDDWIQRHQNKGFDENGEWAKQGVCNQALLARLLDDKYFKLSPPKSTGRNYFNLQWLQNYLADLQSQPNPADVQATLLALSVISISDALDKLEVEIDEILLCGGGAHNTALKEMLQNKQKNAALNTTEKYALSPDCIEAVTFAWLAKQRMENKPGNLPDVTGAKKTVLLGGIYKS